MNVIWTDDATEMAESFLEVSKYVYGETAYQKNLNRIRQITNRLERMPRTGAIEEALADEEGEYRFFLINSRYKLVYRILTEDTVAVFAVWDMKMNPDKLRYFL